MIDHVTYHISEGALRSAALEDFADLLDLKEVNSFDPFEHGYEVRWFRPREQGLMGTVYGPTLHLVADDDYHQSPTRGFIDIWLGLGHICFALGEEGYRRATDSKFCIRESGSGRAWLKYESVRVEVRP